VELSALRQHGHEAGFTMIEVAVASAILAVVMVMVFFSATQVVKTTIRGTANGVASVTAQSQMTALEQYLRGAVSPANAALEYPTVSPQPCAGPPVSASTAVQYAYDYQLQLCSAPARPQACTSANVNAAGSECPQWYLVSVDSSATTCTRVSQCTLKVQDLSVTGSPVVWKSTVYRCPTACQGDLGSSTSTNEEANGVSPATPYLFAYFNSAGTQIKGSSTTSIQSIAVEEQVLAIPAPPTASMQTYTDLSDTVWLTGAAAPQT
jgi:prepilin-type N-terminal cleavage/methylation domain-containing protein